jgi:methylthioribose-1-phosphate isomerase
MRDLTHQRFPTRYPTTSPMMDGCARGMMNNVIVDADSITQDAVFNKIGTYTYSIVANEHDVPFYVAAPVSTFERMEVEIELQDGDELRLMRGRQIAGCGGL